MSSSSTLSEKLLVAALGDLEPFSRLILRRPLRPYQLDPARALIKSILHRDGEQYVWRFPRQSGKNETLAHVQAYIIYLYQFAGGSIVHTAPTFEPQAHLALNRLVDITRPSPFFQSARVSGNTFILGMASCTFVSGMQRDQPLVGLTASLLLAKDEAQDLVRAYIERAFDPMTVSTNAPHVHTGTARHTDTYLAQKRIELEELTRKDGMRRVFIINWRDVASVAPAYGKAVQRQIALKGAQHPAIVSEFENVETAQSGRLFDDRRLPLIFTTPAIPRHIHAQPGSRYVVTIDVGGTDLVGTPSSAPRTLAYTLANSASSSSSSVTTAMPAGGSGGALAPSPCMRGEAESPLQRGWGEGIRAHDFTVAAVHEVAFRDGLSRFDTVDYLTFEHGENVLDQTPARAVLFGYIQQWNPLRIVADGTGIGAGLVSALQATFGDGVMAVIWSAVSKTNAINQWLALIETNRYHHYAPCDASMDIYCARVREQFQRCAHSIHANAIAWGIDPSVTWTNPLTQQEELLHDDHLLADALVAFLADEPLSERYFEPQVVTSDAVARERATQPPRRGRY